MGDAEVAERRNRRHMTIVFSYSCMVGVAICSTALREDIYIVCCRENLELSIIVFVVNGCLKNMNCIEERRNEDQSKRIRTKDMYAC